MSAPSPSAPPSATARRRFFEILREALARTGERVGPVYGLKVPPAPQREAGR